MRVHVTDVFSANAGEFDRLIHTGEGTEALWVRSGYVVSIGACAEANQLSVRTELQADFLAGIWAHYEQSMKDRLDPGDVEEALQAANAVGDDRLQKQGQGYAVPDSFTHGTSAQRMKWFRLGYETGDLSHLMEPFKVSYSQL